MLEMHSLWTFHTCVPVLRLPSAAHARPLPCPVHAGASQRLCDGAAQIPGTAGHTSPKQPLRRQTHEPVLPTGGIPLPQDCIVAAMWSGHTMSGAVQRAADMPREYCVACCFACVAWRCSACTVAHPAGSIPHPLLPGLSHLRSPAVHSSWLKTPRQTLRLGAGLWDRCDDRTASLTLGKGCLCLIAWQALLWWKLTGAPGCSKAAALEVGSRRAGTSQQRMAF